MTSPLAPHLVVVADCNASPAIGVHISLFSASAMALRGSVLAAAVLLETSCAGANRSGDVPRPLPAQAPKPTPHVTQVVTLRNVECDAADKCEGTAPISEMNDLLRQQAASLGYGLGDEVLARYVFSRGQVSFARRMAGSDGSRDWVLVMSAQNPTRPGLVPRRAEAITVSSGIGPMDYPAVQDPPRTQATAPDTATPTEDASSNNSLDGNARAHDLDNKTIAGDISSKSDDPSCQLQSQFESGQELAISSSGQITSKQGNGQKIVILLDKIPKRSPADVKKSIREFMVNRPSGEQGIFNTFITLVSQMGVEGDVEVHALETVAEKLRREGYLDRAKLYYLRIVIAHQQLGNKKKRNATIEQLKQVLQAER